VANILSFAKMAVTWLYVTSVGVMSELHNQEMLGAMLLLHLDFLSSNYWASRTKTSFLAWWLCSPKRNMNTNVEMEWCLITLWQDLAIAIQLEFYTDIDVHDRLCVLVVRVPGCRHRGPGFDSRGYQIFWVAVGLGRVPLSPCEDKWGVTWKKSIGSGLENWD
jgi:hypothetical protein